MHHPWTSSTDPFRMGLTSPQKSKTSIFTWFVYIFFFSKTAAERIKDVRLLYIDIKTVQYALKSKLDFSFFQYIKGHIQEIKWKKRISNCDCI